MRDQDEPELDAGRSGSPDLLERLFRYARADRFMVRKRATSEIGRDWERYEKNR